MNSLTKTAKCMSVSLAILFFWGLCPVYSDPAGPEWTGSSTSEPAYDMRSPEDQQVSAGEAALVAAEGIMKKIGIWKRVDRFKEKFKDYYSFEFRKSFGRDAEEPHPGKAAGKAAEKSNDIVFYGGMSPDMTPVLMFESTSRPADFAIRFDALDQNMDFEISSPPVNRMAGGKTSLGLSSDGSDSQAVLKFAVEF